MAPQSWTRVEEILHHALEQPPESRDGWLDEACASDLILRAEVASLLESHSAVREDLFSGKIQRAVMGVAAYEVSKSAWEGRRIGPWRLIREIGRGGMGA